VQISRVSVALLAGLVVSLGVAVPAGAQSLPGTVALPSSLLPDAGTGINVSRDKLNSPFASESVSNLNLGMAFSPARGLDLRADAWRIEVQEPLAAARLMPEPPKPATPGSSLFIDDSNLYKGLIEAPSVKDSVVPGQMAHGIDLSASYVWESPRFGQFIVSTKASYLYDPDSPPRGFQGPLLPMSENSLVPSGTELQSSVMLTWQAGQHTASAVTHYFDSFEEIGKLDMEQLNEIVGNMTTLDLQYGYNMKAGKQGQAVFSIGVRNLFDTRPQPLPAAGAGQVEQGGRVAYGSIKYQF
jgi:hypothetical protein